MHRCPLLSVLTLVLSVCVNGCLAPPPITGHVDTFPFSSRIVGDSYAIEVRLPPSYDSSKSARYPVAYQLDATDFGPEFDISAGFASSYGDSGRIPETIVVGVGYDYPTSTGYPDPGPRPIGRWRDDVFTYSDGTPGGGANFLKFLEQELIPYIDRTYRTDVAAGRGLMGHSLGGYFAAATLFLTGMDAEPPFRRFVIGDPSTSEENFHLFDLESALSAQTQSLQRIVYYGVARFDGAPQELPTDIMWSRLRAHYPDLHLETQLLQTDHEGAEVPCFSTGLAFIMGGGL
jgi:predicted alpha/beta superfamily hydrolase